MDATFSGELKMSWLTFGFLRCYNQKKDGLWGKHMKTNFHSILSIGACVSFTALTLGTATADPLDSWTNGQLLTNPPGQHGIQLMSVAYGNGHYVAVGQYAGDDNGMIQTSEDGTNWIMRTKLDYSIFDLYDVTYGNGTFVAVGWDAFTGHNIYTSTNGSNWTSHTTAIANIYSVAYDGDQFIAVGDGASTNGVSTTNRNIYLSDDNGATWNAVSSGAPANDVHAIWGVACSSSNHVAIDNVGYLYVSQNGVNWARNSALNPDPSYSSTPYINYCHDRFIALAPKGTNYVSLDGVSWPVMTKDVTNSFTRVMYVSGTYLALSGTNIFTSTNGTNWTRRNLTLPSGTALMDVTLGNGKVLIVGYVLSGQLQPIGYLSDSLVKLGMGSTFPPLLTASGLPGANCRIEFQTNLSSNLWQAGATYTLSNSASTWTDTQATNSARYYRAVLLP